MPSHRPRDRVRKTVGLPAGTLVALAALGVPRAVLHDLDLAAPAVTWLLAIAPPAIWLVVVLAERVQRPFAALFVIGLLYGLMLAATHQLLWTEAFDGDPPRLGDQLRDAPDWVHAVVTRSAAFVSSLVTGAVVGAFVGAVAIALDRPGRPSVRTG